MAINNSGKSTDNDFWNLDEYARKKRPPAPREFSKSATEAVEINGNELVINNYLGYSDAKLSNVNNSETTITRFIPPHKDSVYAQKHLIYEYEPTNPLIKKVAIYSDKKGEKLFPDSNLFIRERRAILNRTATECQKVSYYSYFPRYSQMSRAQLNWYLWWRENTRNGVFIKTDESYVILYAYELVTAGDGEDKNAALNMLCALLTNFSDKDISTVYRMMIRDLICDFCLIHGLPAPLDKLVSSGNFSLTNAPIPEFFVDFSDNNREMAVDIGMSAISVYDYRKSKLYSPESAKFIKKIMNESLATVICNNETFKSITSFTDGMYGCITAERRPFARLTNIVNRSVKLEISYYQLQNIQPALTDAMRYSENKLREHMGVKNKLHIMSIMPAVKETLDAFFEEHYPAKPTVDRRRKATSDAKATEAANEYDKLYDVPKTEISPERALEIERESWDTTKILTEAFLDEEDITKADPDIPRVIPQNIDPTQAEPHEPEASAYTSPNPPMENSTVEETGHGLLYSIKTQLGSLADFVELCREPSSSKQRAFAASNGRSIDEIADAINECVVEFFGDIILEDQGGAYGIIEDYIDQL